MTNSTPFEVEGFLASTADLVGLLAQFNAQPNRRSRGIGGMRNWPRMRILIFFQAVSGLNIG